LHIKIDEVNDLVATGQQAVEQVAGDAAEDEAKGDASGQRVGIEMVPRQKQCDEREQRDERERAVIAAKQAPRRAGIAPMHEFEEAVDDDFFIALVEQVQHEPFGELVEDEHDRRDGGDVAVGLGGRHSFESKVQSPKSKVQSLLRAGGL